MDIIKELEKVKKMDASFENILGSMCTIPHQVAVKAYEMFIETNLGDYELFKGTKLMEEEAIKWVAGFMHAPPGYAGMLTSGGTESNITALWIFKKLSGKKEVLIPEHAHFSFQKASSLLDLKLNVVNSKYFMKARDVIKKISDRTACVVCVAGNTPFGYIDEIEEIAEICSEENIFLHVDAAFGGFIAPFVSKKIFDFRAKISSLCIDAHKMGMACIPCGFLLLRRKEWIEEIRVRSICTHTKFQAGLLGTRPGASAASAYAVMKHLGYEGYEKIARECMENTEYLASLLEENGIDYVDYELNLIAIKSERPVEVAEELAKMKWFVGVDEKNSIIRIVLMPHVKKDIIEKFVTDLKKVI